MLFYKVLKENIENRIYNQDETITIRLNNKTFYPKIVYLNESEHAKNEKLSSKSILSSLIKIFESNEFYDYLYKLNSEWLLQWTGNTCTSSKMLKESIYNITDIVINSDDNTIYFCGEYTIDREHGFAINFPNGKFIKSGKNATTIVLTDQAYSYY